MVKNLSKIPHRDTETLRNTSDKSVLLFWHLKLLPFGDFYKNFTILRINGEQTDSETYRLNAPWSLV